MSVTDVTGCFSWRSWICHGLITGDMQEWSYFDHSDLVDLWINHSIYSQIDQNTRESERESNLLTQIV